jgi:hypothetical protein
VGHRFDGRTWLRAGIPVILAGLIIAGCSTTESSRSAPPSHSASPTTGASLPTPTTSIPPPTSITTSTIPGALQELQSCENSIDHAAQRNLAYQPSQRMRVNQYYQVIVVLSDGSIPSGRVQHLFPGRTPTTIVRIATPCQVSATLIGNNFDISPPDAEQQSFAGSNGILQWSWSVTPTSPGNLQLTLEIDPVYEIGGVNTPGQSQYYQKRIDVTAEPSSVSNKLTHDLSTPVSAAVITGLVTALVATILTRRFERSPKRGRKSKRGRKEPSSPSHDDEAAKEEPAPKEEVAHPEPAVDTSLE